jgi:hypothetical protein
MVDKRRFSSGQIVTMVVAVCAAVALAPVGVMAATGSFINIVDPINGGSKARVNGSGGLHTTTIDALTKSHTRVDDGKLRIGDGSGNLTVDGHVSSRYINSVVYQSPSGGLSCGASAAGVKVGTLDLSRYRGLRFAVHSGPGYQTIIRLMPRAGSEVFTTSFIGDFVIPAGEIRHAVFHDLPSHADMIVFFCNQAKIFVYGLT